MNVGNMDAGGLDYRIQTSGDFAALDTFNRQVDKAKEGMAALQKAASQRRRRRSSEGESTQEQVSEATALSKKISEARERVEVAARKREEREFNKAIQSRTKALQERANREISANEAAALARGRIARNEDQQRIKELRKNIQERFAAQAKMESDIAKVREQNARSNARLLEKENQARIIALRKNIQERLKDQKETLTFWQRLRNNLTSTEGTANRLSFTFRRLFGILAAFALARAAFSGFLSTIREMVGFNSRIEQARLGIASLLLATGNLRDAMGGAVAPTERFPMALKEAKRQMDLLRAESLQTAATFEQLVATFQVALAPGLTAQLNVNQIRQFAVRISQAASALGLAQNQLAEEIRSILEGTINVRTTRIATALGITNEDIRRAREAGKLFEFLQGQFATFEESGKEMLNTFDALFNNLVGGIQMSLGAGGAGFFNEMKDLLRSLQDLFVVRDALTNIATPTRGSVEFFRALGDAFGSLVAEARRLSEALSFDTLASFAKTLGSALRVVGTVLGRVIEGFVKGFRDVQKTVSGVVSLLRKIPGLQFLDTETLLRSLTALARIATVLLTVKILLSSLVTLGGVRLFAAFVPSLLAWAAALQRVMFAHIALIPLMVRLKSLNIGATLATAAGSAFALAKGLGLVLAFLAPLAAFRLGNILQQELTGIPGALVAAWAGFYNTVTTGFTSLLSTLVNALKTAFLGFFQFLRTSALSLMAEISGLLGKALSGNVVTRPLGDALTMLSANLQAEVDKIKVPTLGDVFDGLLADASKTADEVSSAWSGMIQNVRDAYNKSPSPDEGNFFSRVFKQVKKDVTDIIDLVSGAGKVAVEVILPSETATQASSLLEVFDNLEASISGSRKGLEDMASSIQSLENDIRKARLDLDISQGTRSLEGDLASIVRASLEAKGNIQELTKNLSDEMSRVQLARQGALGRQATLDLRINNLPSDEQKKQVDQIISSYEKLRKLTRDEAEAGTEVRLRSLEKESAIATGITEDIASATLALEQQKQAHQEIKDQLEAVRGEYAKTQEFDSLAVSLASEKLKVTGELVTLNEQFTDIEEDLYKVSSKVNEALSVRLSMMAQEAALRLRQDTEQQVLNNTFNRALANNRDVAGRRILEAQRAVNLRQVEIRLLASQNDAETKALDNLIVNATTQEEINSLLELRSAQMDAFLAKQDALNLSLQEENRLLEEAQRIREAPIQAGISQSIKSWKEQFSGMETYFQLTLDTMQSAFDGFADLISSSLVDAFDPSTDESFRNRFANFLKDLAKQIIDMLVRIAVTRAVLNLGGFFGVGFSQGGAVGMAEGGRVPARRSSPKIRRPRGISPRDTVPIWADPSEYIIRGRSVALYGQKVMDAINRGLIDPMTLSALAGAGRAGGVVTPRGMGRATGGPVVPATSRPGMASPPPTQNTPIVQPALIADEHTMQTLLSGGRQPLLDFLTANGYVPNR